MNITKVNTDQLYDSRCEAEPPMKKEQSLNFLYWNKMLVLNVTCKCNLVTYEHNSPDIGLPKSALKTDFFLAIFFFSSFTCIFSLLSISPPPTVRQRWKDESEDEGTDGRHICHMGHTCWIQCHFKLISITYDLCHSSITCHWACNGLFCIVLSCHGLVLVLGSDKVMCFCVNMKEETVFIHLLMWLKPTFECDAWE